ncbi:O-antigen ligase family protein [Lacrimispora sp.]|uniref:O-antigen ligase family protein n=1 Tax=Lacrimispora sp. TaxID=2719234 RepID=UPI0032E50A68
MKTKVKINKEKLFLYFILLPYLKPYNITLIPELDYIFKVWKVLATAILLTKFFYSKKKIHKPTFWLFGFLIIWMLSLIINKGPINDYINNIMSIAGVTMLFEYYFGNDNFKNNIIQSLYSISVWFILLNLYTVVIHHPFFAGGMKLYDNANFLGGDNYSAFILITLCGFMYFYDIKKYSIIRIKTWIVSFASIASLTITFSFMGILTHLILYFAVLAKNIKIRRILFRWQNAVTLGIIIVVSVAYFHLDQIIASLLFSMDKVGFNGRNYIWPMALQAIEKKPLLGYGGITQELASTWFLAGANHTHNILLEYPFSTGIIGTIFFVIYFISVLSKMKSMFADDSLRILMYTLTAYMICSILDFYIGLINFYLLLNMIYLFKNENMINRIIKQKTRGE